jgi:hypothetical protein
VDRAEGLCDAGVELRDIANEFAPTVGANSFANFLAIKRICYKSRGKFTAPGALCFQLIDFAAISYVTRGIMLIEAIE